MNAGMHQCRTITMGIRALLHSCSDRRTSDRCSLGILQRQPQLLRQRIDRCPAALPGALRLEPEIADAAAPRRNHATDRPEIAPVGMLLVEPPDDVWRHPDE